MNDAVRILLGVALAAMLVAGVAELIASRGPRP